MSNKWALGALSVALFAIYNTAQPDLLRMRTQGHEEADIKRREAIRERSKPDAQQDSKKIFRLDNEARSKEKQAYGPSMAWLDRLMNANTDKNQVKLDFNVLSSMMVAGLASGFKSQVANLLWMKSDEYWHSGMLTRQIPIMEAVVTLDPQFVDAWSTAGWHWSYNIYADIEADPRYKKMPKDVADRQIEQRQNQAVDIGLDYLQRGAEMNPDTYRLWFENGYTRANKAGYNDEEVVRLFRTAHSLPDARNIIRDIQVDGKTEHKIDQGLDIVGRQIGHVYESRPDFDKALEQYGTEILHATPQEKALLDAAGQYWKVYSSDYTIIVAVYKQGDPSVKAQIKKLVPDVERMVAAQANREKLQVRDDDSGAQPTGAYISITARYLPAWRLAKAGKTKEAIDNIIGVMHASPKYIMPSRSVVEQVMQIRGDSPQAAQAEIAKMVDYERTSTQDIGLHFLATLYQKAEAATPDPKLKNKYALAAYRTWYRSRVRDSLDFYAKRQTQNYEAKYNFPTPKDIVKSVKDSRKKGGTPDAAPTVNEMYGSNNSGSTDANSTTPNTNYQSEVGSIGNTLNPKAQSR